MLKSHVSLFDRYSFKFDELRREEKFEPHGNAYHLLPWTTAHTAGLERNLPILEWLWLLSAMLRSKVKYQITGRFIINVLFYTVICLLCSIVWLILFLSKLFYLFKLIILCCKNTGTTHTRFLNYWKNLNVNKWQ